MIITYLKLENWCQHRELFVSFSPGSNGIVGTNGKGKSNLIRAIKVALTGKTDKGESFSDDITDGEDRAVIELGFSHDGVNGVLRRRFYRSASNRASLEWGDVKIDGITETNAQLELMTGVTPEAIDKYTFVAQDRLRAVLFDLPSKRMENLIAMIPELAESRLFRDRVDAFLPTIPEVTLPYDEAYLATNLGEVEYRTNQKVRALAGIIASESSLVDGFTRQAADEVLSQQVQYQRTEPRRLDLERKKQSLEERLSKSRVSLAAVREVDSTGLEKFDADAARLKIQEYTSFNFALLEGAKLSTSAGKVAEIAQLVELKDVLTRKLDELAELRDTQKEALAVAGAELAAAEKALRTWEAVQPDGTTTCPLCGSAVTETCLVEMKSAAESRYEEARLQSGSASAAIAVTEQSISGFRRELTAATASHSTLQAEYDNGMAILSTLTPPEITAEEVGGLQRFLQLKAEWEAYVERCQALRAESAQAEHDLQAVVEELASGVYQDAPEPTLLKRATAALAVMNQVQDERSRVVAELEACGREKSRLEAMKAELERVKIEKAKITEFKAVVDSVREHLHRDNLPKYALQHYLSDLSNKFTLYLSKFGVPFTVDISPDFAVSFTKDGGEAKGISRLSGGEKSVVSTALHLAVSDIFSGDLNLLVLDEPSQNMDEDYVTMLTSIIETLSSGTSGINRQLCVVTHHTSEMLGAFSNVIRL